MGARHNNAIAKFGLFDLLRALFLGKNRQRVLQQLMAKIVKSSRTGSMEAVNSSWTLKQLLLIANWELANC